MKLPNLLIVLGIATGLVSFAQAGSENCDGPLDVPAVNQNCAAFSATWDTIMWVGGSCPGKSMYTMTTRLAVDRVGNLVELTNGA